MLAIILTIVVAVGVGVTWERRANRAAHRARRVALETMLWLLLPFVIYVNLARLQLSVDAAVAIVVAAVTIVACGTLMWRLASGPLALARPSAGAAIVCTIQANTGYLGLPLCAALFTHAQFAQAVAYDALIAPPMFVLGGYTVGALFGGVTELRVRERLLRGLLRNPALPAIAAGLLVPSSWAPHALVEPSRIAVFALLPLGFFIVGVTLADEAQDGTLRVPPPLTRPIAAVVALRMLAVPVVLLLALLLIDVPTPFFLLAAMPVGLNTVVVGHATGLDLGLIAASIAWTTTIALAAVLVLWLAGIVG